MAVLFFFGRAPFAPGGFLAISTFLTLSGFTVTRALLRRHHDDDGLRFVPYWAERLRRLSPVALAGITLAVGATVAVGDTSQVRALFGDVLGAVTYTVNWRFLAQGHGFLTIFTSDSSLQHYWAFAVVEQIVLIVVVATLALRTRSADDLRRWLTVALATVTAISVLVTLVVGADHLRAYLGTDTRAAEIAVGGLLALLLARRAGFGTSPHRSLIVWLTSVAAAAVVALWLVTPFTADWVFRGGLPAYAVLSAGVIVGALTERSPLQRGLAHPVPVELGRFAYPLFAAAGPVFMVLDANRTHATGVPLFLLRVTVTAMVAVAVQLLVVERWAAGPRLVGLAPRFAGGILAALLLAVAFVTTASAPTPAIDLTQPFGTAGPVGAPGVPRISVFGDSTAIPIQRGLNGWAAQTNKVAAEPGRFLVGCGVVNAGAWQLGEQSDTPPATCDDRLAQWRDAVASSRPDVVVVTPGVLELANRQLPGDSRWRAVGSERLDDHFREQLLATTDALASSGAKVVWVTQPPATAGAAVDPRDDLGQAADPARARRLNELIGELPAARPGQVQVVDLAGWLQTMGAANDSASRPDGFHLSTAAADQFTRNVLGPQLLELTGVTAPPTAVSAVEAKCAAVGGFVLGEVVANNALPKSRPDREQAFADLQKNGATLQRQEPSLAAAVEAREKWWSAMLGLDKPNGQPAAKAVETPDAASAGARVKAYQQQNCR